METVKPSLYIDVDGVLFGQYGADNRFQLRPGVIDFLEWATEHFMCFWLTAWSQERLDCLLSVIYGGHLRTKIMYCKWTEDKSDCIVFGDDWYWIEDGITDNELARLKTLGVENRYIYVNHVERDELVFIKRYLEVACMLKP